MVLGPDKAPRVLKAKKIVVAASNLETPRLLLYSGIPGRAIGHYLCSQIYAESEGDLPPELVSDTLFSFLIPETEARPYQFKVMYFGGTQVGMNISGPVESRYGNFVYLDSDRTDDCGIPRIQVKFAYSDADKALAALMAEANRNVASVMGLTLSAKAGGRDICVDPPGGANHDTGTCRMGDDPYTSATNRYGQIHGISGLYVADNSVIPDLGGANPTLTTVALAIRTADAVIGQAAAGD